MNTEKISIALSALALGACALALLLGLEVAVNYNDFIVGNITWYAGNKLQDLVAWPAFIVITALGFWGLSQVTARLDTNHNTEASSCFTRQLVLWTLPFYATAGYAVLGGALDNTALIVSGLGVVFLGLAGLSNGKYSREPKPGLWGVAFLTVILAVLMPIEMALVLGRAPMALVGPIETDNFVNAGYALGTITATTYLLLFARRNTTALHYVKKAIFFTQLGMPLFFLVLYPARLLQPSGELSKYNTTLYLKVLVFALIIIGIYDVVRRFSKHAQEDQLKALFSPMAFFGLLVALKVGNTLTPLVSTDDYHTGESLLGWWSYVQGVVPFAGYIPAHGLIDDDLPMLLSSIFYDGTAGSLPESVRLTFAVLSLVAFFSVYNYSGSIALAFISVLLLGGRFSWLFLVPFICLWLSTALRREPGKWLAVWLLSSPFVLFGALPHGLLLILAFGPLSALASWTLIKSSSTSQWVYTAGAITILALLAVTTPLLSMLSGTLGYVKENGPINQLAYGVPWHLSWNEGALSGLAFELLRMSWVVIPLACLYATYKSWRSFGSMQSWFYPAIAFLILSLLLVPYSMGRIDPNHLSRPGQVSIVGWTVLLPLLVWGVANNTGKVFMLLLTTFMGSAMGFWTVSFSNLASTTAAMVQTATLRNGASSGLDNIGIAEVTDTQWDRISRLDALLDARLTPEETYLDLSSRHAHYFYVNRRPVVPITAPYNLVPVGQQKRTIDILEKNTPKIALLQADNVIHDGGGLSLRNPYLYRFILEHYEPKHEYGFIVGHTKDSLGSGRGTVIDAEIKNITNDTFNAGIHRRAAAMVLSDPVLVLMLKSGDKIRFANGESKTIQKTDANDSTVWFEGNPLTFPDGQTPKSIGLVTSNQTYREYKASLFQRSLAISDLKKIPVSWGRSAQTLKTKMALITNLDNKAPVLHDLDAGNGQYTVTGSDPFLSFDLSHLDISGKNTGLLKLEFACTGIMSEPRLQIFWWGDDRDGPYEASSIRLTAANGTLIVPLDASPSWLTSDKIKGLRIDLDDASACRVIHLGNMGLYQRK